MVYPQANVILANDDWNENKIVIYADSSHTKESCEAKRWLHSISASIQRKGVVFVEEREKIFCLLKFGAGLNNPNRLIQRGFKLYGQVC